MALGALETSLFNGFGDTASSVYDSLLEYRAALEASQTGLQPDSVRPGAIKLVQGVRTRSMSVKGFLMRLGKSRFTAQLEEGP